MLLPLYSRMRYLQSEGFVVHAISMQADGSTVLQYGVPDDIRGKGTSPFDMARSEKIPNVDRHDYKMGVGIFSEINKDHVDNRKRTGLSNEARRKAREFLQGAKLSKPERAIRLRTVEEIFKLVRRSVKKRKSQDGPKT